MPATASQVFSQNMAQVLVEYHRALSGGLSEEVTHDLRVALRRCRSVAQVCRLLDPHPVWRRLNRDGAALFCGLGELRDMQVLMLWVTELGWTDTPEGETFLATLAQQEATLKTQAAQAVAAFSVQDWSDHGELAAERLGLFLTEDPAFAHLAALRLKTVLADHRRALRNQNPAAWHTLRISFKRLRYVIENFLPHQHAHHGKTLKKIQDALGEVHDLDVLKTVLMNAVLPHSARAEWRGQLNEARDQRLTTYRQLASGPAGELALLKQSLPLTGVGAARQKKAAVAAISRCLRGHGHASHDRSCFLNLYAGFLETTRHPLLVQAPAELPLWLEMLRPLTKKNWPPKTARRFLNTLPALNLDTPGPMAALMAQVFLGKEKKRKKSAEPVEPENTPPPPDPQQVALLKTLLSLAGDLEQAHGHHVEVQNRGAGVVVLADLGRPARLSLKALNTHARTLARMLEQPVSWSLGGGSA